jgi:hypothetical protein
VTAESDRDGLDAAIIAARVSGVSAREICHRFGCTMERVHAVLDAHAERVLAPENLLRRLIENVGRVGVIERTLAPRASAGDGEALRLVAECRRQWGTTGKLILQRAPASRPM